MADYYAPVCYDADEMRHLPASASRKLYPTSIPISSEQGNTLVAKDDGLKSIAVSESAGNQLTASPSDGGAYLRADMLMSADPGNGIRTGSDGKLFTSVAVSQQDGNVIRYGNDHGLYMTAGDLVSLQPGNRVGLSAADGKLYAGWDLGVVSADAGNPLTTGTDDGAYLDPVNLVSTKPGNTLVKADTDGKLYVEEPAPIDPADFISTDVDNRLTLGTDGKLTVSPDPVDPASLVSPDLDNRLELDASGLLLVRPEDPVEANGYISLDADNQIHVGSDEGLYVAAPVSLDTGNYIRKGSDDKAYLDGNDVLSNEANNLLGISSVDGKVMLKKEWLGITKSADAGNLLTTGSDGGLMVKPSDLISADADNTARLGTDGLVYVPPVDAITSGADILADDDAILLLDADNKIASRIGMQYNSLTGQFDLLGRAGQPIASVSVPSSTSMLQNVELTENVSGTYLDFTFLLANGATTKQSVNVTGLVDVYLAGQALELVDKRFSVKIVAAGGLGVDADNSLFVRLADLVHGDTNALVVKDGKLYVAPVDIPADYHEGDGIQIDASRGIAVKLADDTPLEFTLDHKLDFNVDKLVYHDSKNLLKINTQYGQLYVSASDLVSTEAGNSLKLDTTGGKLFVPPIQAGISVGPGLTYVSDTVNLNIGQGLSINALGQLQADAQDVQVGPGLTKTGARVDLYLGHGLSIDAVGRVQADAQDVELGPGLTVNAQGKIIPDLGQGIKIDPLTNKIVPDLGPGLKIDGNGKVAFDADALITALISADTGNQLRVGSDGGLFTQQVVNYGDLNA